MGLFEDLQKLAAGLVEKQPPAPGDEPLDINSITDPCVLITEVEKLVGNLAGVGLDDQVKGGLTALKKLRFLEPINLHCIVTTDNLTEDEGTFYINPGLTSTADAKSTMETADKLSPGLLLDLVGSDIAAPNTPLNVQFDLNNDGDKPLDPTPIPFLGQMTASITEDDDWFNGGDDSVGPVAIPASQTGPKSVEMTGDGGRYRVDYIVRPAIGEHGLLRSLVGCETEEGKAINALTVERAPVYGGAWRSSSPASHVVTPRTRDSFIKAWDSLSKNGWRLEKIQSLKVRDMRRWSGIFVQGTDGYGLLFGTLQQVLAQHNKFMKQGLRMTDAASYVENGQRYWAGVWRAGEGQQHFITDLNWEAFVEKWKALSNQQMRLSSFHSYYNGKRLWAGVFSPGTDGYGLWRGNWQSFTKKWAEFTKSGLRPVDLDCFYEGGKQYWAGVFRGSKGTDGHQLLAGLSPDDMKKAIAKAKGDGMHLTVLETY